MPRTSLARQLRFVILFIGVLILGLDTARYYWLPTGRRLPTATIVEISPSPTSIPLPPTPVPSTTEPTPPFHNSRIKNFFQVESIDQAQIEAAQKSFVGSPQSTSVSKVAIYTLEYEIQSQDGSWQPTTAQVYIPLTAGAYPLYVFGSGTTGIADKCRPSLENVAVENVGNYRNHMIAQAAAGYVSVFPDYEGYHNPDVTEAYFIAESEAKVLLGAIRSLQELQPNTAVLQTADLKNVFLAGYSQGGHAALSAAREWSELPPDTQLRGVIQFAGAADVEALFLDSPWLASYLVASFVDYYKPELASSTVLQDRWLQEMNRNNAILCVNQAYRYYPKPPSEMYTPAFLDAIETRTWPDALSNWNEAIQVNIPLTDLPNVPYLSIQGEADPIVTATTQRRNTDVLCQQKYNITYREYAGVNHFQIRQVSFGYSNDWMRQVLAGQAETKCQ